MARFAPAAVCAAVCAVALCGCFTFRSTIAVRPDGSGTLTETLALSGPAREMMRGSDAPLSTAEALLSRAARLGDGVTLVHTDTLGGVRTTVYAFRDVAGLRYRLPDNATEPEQLAAVAGLPPLYTFAFDAATAGAPAALHITTPDGPPDAFAPPDTAAVAESLVMTRVLMADAHATVEVVALGEPAEGTAATTTLIDLPFGPLLDLVGRHPELASSQSVPLDAVRRRMTPADRLVIQPPGTTTVRFR